MISPEWDHQLERELCIRCGRPTPYEINTSVEIWKWYVDGSGQFCEQCFSQLYSRAASTRPSGSTSPGPSNNPVPGDQENTAGEENIKTITLGKGRTPTLADQGRYNQLINKPTLTDADREELARLYKKYTV